MVKGARSGWLSAAVLLLVVWESLALADVLEVPENYPTIAAAQAAAGFGDTLSLAPGTYALHDHVWRLGIAILGRTGRPEEVVLDAEGQGRVLAGDGLVPQNVLAYLTLRNGNGNDPYGGGVMVVGDPLLHDLIIEDCTASSRVYGIGLAARGGATITDCILRNNRSSVVGCEGGGAWLQGASPAHAIHAENLEVYGNEAEFSSGIHFNERHGFFTGVYCHDNLGSGMVIYNGSLTGIGPTIEYSCFAENAESGIVYDADAIIRSCTFVGNGAIGGAAAIRGGSSWDFTLEPRITQCVVAFNMGAGIHGMKLTPYTIDCNDVFANAGGNYVELPDLTGLNGNIEADPQFCGRGGWPYALEADSPCLEVNNDCGLLLGAFSVGCPNTAVARRSWGAVKALY